MVCKRHFNRLGIGSALIRLGTTLTGGNVSRVNVAPILPRLIRFVTESKVINIIANALQRHKRLSLLRSLSVLIPMLVANRTDYYMSKINVRDRPQHSSYRSSDICLGSGPYQ